jgi:hypothetical protein
MSHRRLITSSSKAQLAANGGVAMRCALLAT